ncbi:MAG: bL35 family ribosomal protein [bacterium]
MKIKTHKATAKRFKLTGNNKLRHLKQGNNTHLKAHKSHAQKARKKGMVVKASGGERSKILKLLGKR